MFDNDDFFGKQLNVYDSAMVTLYNMYDIMLEEQERVNREKQKKKLDIIISLEIVWK